MGTGTHPPTATRAYLPVLVRLLTLALALAIVALPACTTEAPPAQTPTFADIAPSSVSLVSAQEGWAVGWLGTGGPPTYMLHLHEGTWSRVPLSDSADGLRKVVMLSPTNGWAVGQDDVFHYDGARWTLAYTPPPSQTDGLGLQDVAFLSPTEGWAVGLAGMLHYHNGQWSDVSASLPHAPPPSPGAPAPHLGFRALALVSPRDGWAVGAGGALWHYDGATWRPASAPDIVSPYLAPSPYVDVSLFGVALTSSHTGSTGSTGSTGWAVGGEGSEGHVRPFCTPVAGVVKHLTAGRWTVALRLQGVVEGAAGQPTLRAVALMSPTEGWAAGALLHRKHGGNGDANLSMCMSTSYLMHLSGGVWTVVPVPDVGTINGLAFDSPDDGWAAADGGLLHYRGGTWTAVLM